MARVNTPEDFWKYVDKNGPVQPHVPELGNCWEWKLHKNKYGYGHFWMEGKGYKAHRFVMGNPEEFCLHKCDNTRCVNPDHIFLGTQADNVRDCAAKGRFRKVNLTARKWTEDQIGQMRAMRKQQMTYQAIADHFNTSRGRIHEALNRWYRDYASSGPMFGLSAAYIVRKEM